MHSALNKLKTFVMNFLTIDPSCRDIGWCVWKGGAPSKWGHYNVTDKELEIRLNKIICYIHLLLQEHDIEWIVLENPVQIYRRREGVLHGAEQLLKMAKAVGAIYAVCFGALRENITLVEPRVWNRKHKSKKEIRAQVDKTYKIKAKNSHIADAISIGDWFCETEIYRRRDHYGETI
jgi:Holliday junction resolvasome RuvABC endonuclease subunit